MALYGVDSLLVMKLSAALEREIGPVQPTIFFDHPTLRSLAAELQSSHATKFATPVAQAAPTELDGIAIIGMAGRFPDAASVDALWDNLLAGTDVIRPVPSDRWDFNEFHDANPGRPGKAYAQWGGFIPNVEQFDPAVLQYRPRRSRSHGPAGTPIPASLLGGNGERRSHSRLR